MSLTPLLSNPPEFLLFGGKGGVGKTTMAAASALAIAERHPDHQTLVFTTDPAPSLADSFGQALGNEPVALTGVANLFAMEIDAKQEIAKFRAQYGEDILNILQEGTYLEDSETEELFALDIPGLDEVMGLKKIMDFMEGKAGGGNAEGGKTVSFDHYILDTAPTGHTLRLLALPELLDTWIQFLSRLRWKYHAMVNQFSRGKERRVEHADEFLLDMKKTVKRVRELLRDPKRTSFTIVTIAEAMGVAETRDLVQELTELQVPHEHLIVNNVVPVDVSSFLQARRAVQDRYLKELRDAFPKLNQTVVELQADEVRGIEQLRAFGKKLL
jgi:arsenite/tail-anchored protein-transporting ATPase